MTWLLIDKDGFDHDSEREDADNFEVARTILAAKPLQDGTDDVVQLLEKLGSDSIPAAFPAPLAKALKRLQKWYRQALAANLGIQDLQSLSSNLGSICATQQDQTKSLVWPFDATGQNAFGSGILLNLGLIAKAGAKLTVCPPLPGQAAPLPQGYVALVLGLKGSLDIDAGADIPLPSTPFSVGLNASLLAEVSIQHYSLHNPGMRFAPAVAAAFSRLGTSPFDLQGVAERFKHYEWHCITQAVEGGISVGGKIALASPASLANGINLIDMTYGYTALLEGKFDYLLQADPAQSGKVLLRLTRRRTTGYRSEAVAKVGVDLSSAYERIRHELLSPLMKANEILTQASLWLAPGTAVGKLIHEQIITPKKDDLAFLVPALESLFGFLPGDKAFEGMQQILEEAIFAESADLGENFRAAASKVLSRVVARLGLNGDLRSKLEEALGEALEEAIGSIQKKVQAELRSRGHNLIGNDIKAALEEVGKKFQGNLNDLNDKTKALQQLVQRFREMAKPIYDTLESTTELKLNLQLRSTTAHTDSEEADLVLRFDPQSEAAQNHFRKAMLGAFAELLRRLDKGPADGVELLLDCNLSRVIAHSEEMALEVSVLGIPLVMSSLWQNTTRINSDAAGNISVLSQAAFQRERKIWGEKKSISLANVFSLVCARQTRSLKLTATLSYEDKKLDVKEARGFLKSLSNNGLLPTRGADNAADMLREFEIHTPMINVEGRLDVSLPLEGKQIERLLGIGEANSDSYLERVEKIASEEMAQACIKNQAKWSDEKFLLSRLSKAGCIVGATLAETIPKFDNQNLVNAMKPMEDSTLWNFALEVNHMYMFCEELKQSLKVMQALYTADFDTLSKWTADTYWNMQEKSMLFAKDGLPGDFPKIFGSESVHPEIQALFRILARISERLLNSSQGDVLVATMTLGSGDKKRTIQLA